MWDTYIVKQYSSDLFRLLDTKNEYIISNGLQNIHLSNITVGYDVCNRDLDTYTSEITYKTFEKLLDEMNIEKIYVNSTLDIENLLPLIDSKCGFKIEFPDVFNYSSKSSVTCSRGKVSNRMVYALYYTWNIVQQVTNVKECSILEIGGGLGRIPYYAYKFGFKKYTIVDILSTNIIQFHYNSCVFGSHNVSLFGETNFNACFFEFNAV